MKLNKNKYQLNFSDNHKILYDKSSREQKADKILAVLEDYYGELNHLDLLDVGSSSGVITQHLSKMFNKTIGIDIDQKAVNFAKKEYENERLRFFEQDSMDMKFSDNTFDVVNCTHIYEHVPDSKKLLEEIYRVLKPNGVCFFAAGNRFVFMEAHYQLPLLSVVPKFIAHKYIKLFKKADFYYETHLTYWGLKRLTSKFKIYDYSLEIIKNPVKYSATDMVKENSFVQFFYLFVLKIAYWLCPTYIWLLKKK